MFPEERTLRPWCAPQTVLLWSCPAITFLRLQILGRVGRKLLLRTRTGGLLLPRADATRIVASGANGFDPYPIPILYTTTDSAASWISNSLPGMPLQVACSADGNLLMTGLYPGTIYTSRVVPTPKLYISLSDSSVALDWLVPSMSFVLQQTSDLSSGEWSTVLVTPTLDYTNLHYRVTLPKSRGQVFYQLKSQ